MSRCINIVKAIDFLRGGDMTFILDLYKTTPSEHIYDIISYIVTKWHNKYRKYSVRRKSNLIYRFFWNISIQSEVTIENTFGRLYIKISFIINHNHYLNIKILKQFNSVLNILDSFEKHIKKIALYLNYTGFKCQENFVQL